MGYAIADAAIEAGHEVTLISGPVALTAPPAAQLVAINTSDELYEAVHAHVANCDLLVMCAAVSDYRPMSPARKKLQKKREAFALQVQPTRDILASLPVENRTFFIVGFAAETHDVAASAMRKLSAKNCDVIVANDVSRSDSGMESDHNEVTLFFRDREPKHIARAEKQIIAREILKIVCPLTEKSLTKKT